MLLSKFPGFETYYLSCGALFSMLIFFCDNVGIMYLAFNPFTSKEPNMSCVSIGYVRVLQMDFAHNWLPLYTLYLYNESQEYSAAPNAFNAVRSKPARPRKKYTFPM
ncbi:hypothetical protein LXL04_027594 [Taraxacum kok-saghyz]